MKHFRITLLVLLMTSFAMIAQDRRKMPNVSQMHEQKWEMISNEAALTPKEIKIVKPIFLKYEKAMWELHQSRRDEFRYDKRTKKQQNIDYRKLNDQYVNYELKQAQLLRMYHLKLRNILSPEKLFNYYKAERLFKRNLLRNMPPPPPPQQENY